MVLQHQRRGIHALKDAAAWDELQKWLAYAKRLEAEGKTSTAEARAVGERLMAAFTAYHNPPLPVRPSEAGIRELRGLAEGDPPPRTFNQQPQRKQKHPRPKPRTVAVPSPSLSRECWEWLSTTVDKTAPKDVRQIIESIKLPDCRDYFHNPIPHEVPEFTLHGLYSSAGYGDRFSSRYCPRCRNRYLDDEDAPGRCRSCFAPRDEYDAQSVEHEVA